MKEGTVKSVKSPRGTVKGIAIRDREGREEKSGFSSTRTVKNEP